MTSSLTSLVLSLVACASIAGCGAVVTISEGGGDEGDGAVVPPPPNAAECPSSVPAADDACSYQGLSCHYEEAFGCVVTYVCEGETSCSDDGPCEELGHWVTTEAVCTGQVVDCKEAQSGDACALPGESCNDYFECNHSDKQCGEDHTWVVSYWEEACCVEECG